MRKVRERRSDNELHLENLLAKNGMRTLRQLGNLKKFQQRNPRELDDETLWYRFWLKGIEYREILRTKLPEVSKLFATTGLEMDHLHVALMNTMGFVSLLLQTEGK